MTLSKSTPILISSFSFLFSFLCLATPVRAENQIQNQIQNQIEERREIRLENKEDKQEMREENKDNRLELRRQNALKIANNIVFKLEKRFEYLNKIHSRLQLKITNLKTTHDMTDAQKKIDLYDTTRYATNLAALKAKVATITTTDKPKTVVPALKEATKLVQKDLKDLHQFLVEVLKLTVKAPKINQE